jgi:hypothetical protein
VIKIKIGGTFSKHNLKGNVYKTLVENPKEKQITGVSRFTCGNIKINLGKLWSESVEWIQVA